METVHIADLLGRASTDPRVELELVHFRIDGRPQLKFDENDVDDPIVETSDWLLNSGVGVEFGFEDEAAFLGHDRSEYGIGPMLLTQMYFYGVHDGVKPYSGPLPFGLRYSDDRLTVRSKLAAFDATRRSYLRDAWELDQFTFVVSYVDDNSQIDFVLCLLRQPALSAVNRVKPILPPLPTIVELFGKGWKEREVRDMLAGVGVSDQDGSRGGPLLISRRRSGFDLVFRESPVVDQEPRIDGLVFSEAVFFRDRVSGARRWPGPLPLGISFDDSPEAAIAKVPAAPTKQSEDDFTGWALWHLRHCSVQVHYSTMENFITQVRLMAPGVWEALKVS